MSYTLYLVADGHFSDDRQFAQQPLEDRQTAMAGPLEGHGRSTAGPPQEIEGTAARTRLPAAALTPNQHQVPRQEDQPRLVPRSTIR